MTPTPEQWAAAEKRARAVRRFIRDNNLSECATCGKAAAGDPVTVAAIYSVKIENPALNLMLCSCERP